MPNGFFDVAGPSPSGKFAEAARMNESRWLP